MFAACTVCLMLKSRDRYGRMNRLLYLDSGADVVFLTVLPKVFGKLCISLAFRIDWAVVIVTSGYVVLHRYLCHLVLGMMNSYLHSVQNLLIRMSL